MFTRIAWIAAAMAVFASVSAFGQSVVGRNANAVGPFPDGFYRGIPHYQDNEPHCDRNPLLEANIVCMVNGYNGSDDLIGDAWPKILETQDNARTWLSRFATGSGADPSTDIGQGFGADPIVTCWPGGCGGFFIASTRAPGGGTGGGVYMQLMPEFNIEVGFRHLSEAGPRTVQLGTGDNFLDKIDAVYLIDEDNPGTIDVTMTVEKGNGVTETVTRTWPRGRLLVVYASLNSSSQNIRIFSTYSDDYGASWSPPKQVANTTGLDTGVAVAANGDTVAYLYRQFEDDSGGEANAVFAAVSPDRGNKIGKPFTVIADLCAFDQPTLPAEGNPDPPAFETVASRTNNFVDVAGNGSQFVAVLAERQRDPSGGCLTQPFDYQAGSRVLVTTAGANGRNWSTPVEIAPRSNADGPRNGHSFQFMPAVDCVLGICQAIWYDSINDSARSIGYLNGLGKTDAVDAFVNFPVFGDFYYPRVGNSGPEVIQFRRTADVMTRQFTVSGGNVSFQGPVAQGTRFQRAFLPGVGVREVEQLPFNLKQYKGNTVSFMGDYIGLASQKVRGGPNPENPEAPPVYESNQGPDPANPELRAKWFAYWTDTRNARGQLYTENLDDAVPFEKSPTAGGLARREAEDAEESDAPAPLQTDRKLTAEGVEDTNPVAAVCTPPGTELEQGDPLPAFLNRNRIKDADVFVALIEQPATAWVLSASKGLGEIPRTYVIAARNELRDAGKTFRFRIINQPVGFDTNEARASWLQLPYENFDNADPLQAPVEEVDEDVGPLSSVTVALFVVSAQAINPVTVNVYEVLDGGGELLVETLTVDGALQAGELVTPVDFLPDVNELEIHNPFVYAPTASAEVDYSNPEIWNPEIWNPEIWNPEIWNPEIWNPEIWNPEIWNPEIWNPEIWNPEIWNPEIWNTSLTDADKLDNEEIPQPDLAELVNPATGELRQPGELVAKFDVQFGAFNDGNTLTPYTADFAVNSALVRELLASGAVKTQLIIWEHAEEASYQACDPDINGGENRVLAVVNNPDLLNLKIPDIFNNRFGSITFNVEPLDLVHATIRFIAFEAVIRQIAPELEGGGISWVVTSQAANTGETSLDVGIEQAINNNVPPSLTVNADDFPVELTAIVQNGEVGAVLPSDLITARDGEFGPLLPVSCDSTSLSSPVALGDFAGLGLGTSELECSATGENAVGTVSFGVDVVDQNPPVLNGVPMDLSVERNGLDGAIVNYSLPTATDDIDDDVAIACSIPDGAGGKTALPPGGTVPFIAPGPTTTQVTCTATDDSGLFATGTFAVTAQDTTPPVIEDVADILVGAVTAAGATVNFATPQATDVGVVTVSCDAVSGSVFPIGSTTVTCTATDDANLSATEIFAITVADTTAPDITPVEDITVEASQSGGAGVTFTAPTANDLGTDLDVTCTAFDPPVTVQSGDFFPIGTTTVTCTASDASGNTASESFDVTVADTVAPQLDLPEDITTILDDVAGALIDYTVTATDVADPSPTVACNPPSGTVFPVGTTTVECTATDASGNSANGSFDATVQYGTGAGLQTNKKSVNAGATASFVWAWTDSSGNPLDSGLENNDIEARPGRCPSSNPDVLNEDPGSSDIREQGDFTITFNWQTVDDFGEPIEPGIYCVSAILLTTGQKQSAELRVR